MPALRAASKLRERRNHHFASNLPLTRNGRALQSGGGGLGGQVITAPDIGPTDLTVERTAPVCRYPMDAKYNGSGDTKQASSFSCTARTDPLAFDPKR